MDLETKLKAGGCVVGLSIVPHIPKFMVRESMSDVRGPAQILRLHIGKSTQEDAQRMAS